MNHVTMYYYILGIAGVLLFFLVLFLIHLNLRGEPVETKVPDDPTQDWAKEPCSACGQIDMGQTGTKPCPVCGLPTLWDNIIKAKVPIDPNMEEFVRIASTYNDMFPEVEQWQKDVMKALDNHTLRTIPARYRMPPSANYYSLLTELPPSARDDMIQGDWSQADDDTDAAV